MALIRFRASAGQGAFGGGFPPSAMDGGMGTSAGIDDMYPSQPKATVGPMPPQQQQPVGGGGGVGAVNSSSYYPPPTFWPWDYVSSPISRSLATRYYFLASTHFILVVHSKLSYNLSPWSVNPLVVIILISEQPDLYLHSFALSLYYYYTC